MDTEDLLTVSEELAAVTRLVENDDVSTAVTRYVRRVVRVVPGCDAAFVSAAGDAVADTVAGTWTPRGSKPSELGPVGEVLTYHEPRRIGDVRIETRWPEFTAELAAAGFRSALTLALGAAGDAGAAFTLLGGEPEAFGESSFDLVRLFTVHAGVVLDNATLYRDCHALVDQLHVSLRTRSTIGQAQGLLMAGGDLDAAAAFDALRRASQQHNTKLRDLAVELVDAQASGELAGVIARYGLSGSVPPAS